MTIEKLNEMLKEIDKGYSAFTDTHGGLWVLYRNEAGIEVLIGTFNGKELSINDNTKKLTPAVLNLISSYLDSKIEKSLKKIKDK